MLRIVSYQEILCRRICSWAVSLDTYCSVDGTILVQYSQW
jgi:hypothetical protein